ncbi:Lcl domain-containing protein [Thiolapillus sp.]
MKNTILSVMIFGIIQLNVHATVATAQATSLTMVNEDLVLDQALAVEWARDANLVKTMCDARHPLWQSFEPEAIALGTHRNRDEICSQDGVMNWYEARAWISHLNKHAFLGYNNWRLPRTRQSDASCSHQFINEQPQASFSFGHGCRNSELSHLFHASLGNPAGKNKACKQDCLTNAGPFRNLSESMYWSGTEISFDSSMVGVFDLGRSWQDAENKTSDLLHVWPVRSL